MHLSKTELFTGIIAAALVLYLAFGGNWIT